MRGRDKGAGGGGMSTGAWTIPADAARISRDFKFAADDFAFATRTVPGRSHQLTRILWIHRVGKNVARPIGENGVFADAGFAQGFGGLAQHGSGLIGPTRPHGAGYRRSGSDHRKTLIQSRDALAAQSDFSHCLGATARCLAVSSCHVGIVSEICGLCQSLHSTVSGREDFQYFQEIRDES